MLVGVISDTHDRLDMIDRAIDLFLERNIQAMLHPGDVIAPFAAKRLLRYPGPIYITYGNNDGERQGLKSMLPQIQDGPIKVSLGSLKFLVHHYVDWCDRDDIEQSHVIVTGHTHEVTNERRNNQLFLNPGECCGWVHGRCTVALLDTEQLHADIVEL